jgi:acyl-CoA thioesterase I
MRFKAMFGTLLTILSLTVAALPAKADPVMLVGFGDSLMAGYQIALDEAFPARLEKRLRDKGHDVIIINAGVSGDTTADGLARIDWSIPGGTKGVILELGANDALRGLSPSESRKNLEAMIVRLKERKIAILLAGIMAPPNMGKDYADAFNPIYGELAKKYDLPLYPYFLEGVTLKPELQLEDGMHPNPKGTEVMADNFLKTAEAFLKSLSP